MNFKGSSILLLIVFTLALFSCEKEAYDPNKPQLSEEVLILNNWIWKEMNDIYLWEDELPNLDPEYQEDPRQYFYDLLNIADIESWIVDDYDAHIARFQGVSTATGMSVRPGLLDSTRVVSIVLFVTPASPASEAGVKRGDIIITIDGQDLNKDNYYTLYGQTTASFGFADWDGTELIPKGEDISLTTIELSKNPIVHNEIIEYQGKKVGYMVYTQFTTGKTGEWLEELNMVFEKFKNAGVSDLVVDLRYNGGGSLDLSAYFASTLAPETYVRNEEIFVNMIWNDRYNQLWRDYDYDKDGKADGEDSPQLLIKLRATEVNFDLSTVYFLTTEGTASACESLMAGLYPYMDVVQIGSTTHGKPYGSVTIDDWRYETKRHNWAMQPIVLKWANADGFTDFVNGIDPDIFVEEHLLNLEAFGSLDEPLLAKALEQISGVNPMQKSLLLPVDNFNPLPVIPEKTVEMHISLDRELVN